MNRINNKFSFITKICRAKWIAAIETEYIGRTGKALLSNDPDLLYHTRYPESLSVPSDPIEVVDKILAAKLASQRQ